MEEASKMNESYPIMIDQETRLDSVSFIAMSDNVFQYNCTLINWVKDSLNIENLRNYLEPGILKSVKQRAKTNPTSKMFSKNKVTIAFHYRDKNGEFILKIMITSEQYN